MTTPWSSFYDYTAPDLPGCPLELIDLALRQSAISFCENSLAWHYDHPAITVSSGAAAYDFIPPQDAVVHSIFYAKWNDTEIDSNTSETELASKVYDWRNATGTPTYVLGGSSLQIVPNPDSSGTLRIKVTLKPSVTATTIDSNVFNEFREAIAHGALARLMYSPKKPYTNPALAQYHAQQFDIKTGQAGTKQARNFTRAPLRTAILTRG